MSKLKSADILKTRDLAEKAACRLRAACAEMGHAIWEVRMAEHRVKFFERAAIMAQADLDQAENLVANALEDSRKHTE